MSTVAYFALGLCAAPLLIWITIAIIGPRVVVGRRLALEHALLALLILGVDVYLSVTLYLSYLRVENASAAAAEPIRAATLMAIALTTVLTMALLFVIHYHFRKTRETLFFFRIPRSAVQQIIGDTLRELQWGFGEQPNRLGKDFSLKEGRLSLRNELFRIRVDVIPPADRTTFIAKLRARLMTETRIPGLVIKIT